VSKTGEVLRADAAFMALTMDIITTYVYGKSYDHLNHPDFNLEWKDAIMASFATASLIRLFPWILNILKMMPDSSVKASAPAMGLLIEWQNKVRAQVKSILDGERGDETERNIFRELLASDLPGDQKTLDRLCDEGQILAGAGSETTAKALAATFFYLLRDKAVMEKLRAELTTVMPNPWTEVSWSDLEKLPYLVSCAVVESCSLADKR
jgi:cytochrome P450